MRDRLAWPYIKQLVSRHRRTLAYVFLSAAVAYALYGVQQEAKHRTESLAATRESRANDILASLAEGSVTGCITANTNTLGMHKVVVGSYNAGRKSIEQFVIEGTLTPPQAKRVQRQSFDTTKQYLNDLSYRDCEQAIARYTKQITDANQRLAIEARVKIQAVEALIQREREEPKLKT